MRTLLKASIWLGAAIIATTPACAARLILPNELPETYSAYSAQAGAEPWTYQHQEPELHEQPIAQIIATRLGVAEGSAELFRYRLENAPSANTQLHGMVDGGGIKLKLTW